MSENLCASWFSHITEDSKEMVLPDGCRDLIIKKTNGKTSESFISPLFSQSKIIQLEGHSSFSGFRLKAGVRINEAGILSAIHNRNIDAIEISNLIDDFTSIDYRTEEVLNCLASDVTSIKQASFQLGVSVRTLQRLIMKETEQPPSYWFQLSRVRKAARELLEDTPLIEIANMYGFTDQPHMNREFKRWFMMTPLDILKSEPILSQLKDVGYS